VSNFFQSKNEPKADMNTRMTETPRAATPMAKADSVSTLGAAMQIQGNVICSGTVQVYGKINGDMHVTGLAICDGAVVEGKILAQDTVIQGKFQGTIHSNTVKLTRTAVVDGEIYSKSLMIEQDAQFEGVSRKLDKAVEAPGMKPAMAAPAAAPVAAAPQMTAEVTHLNGMPKPHVVN
jgi:cytoskeletal protein CcmA (bactofilin family)